MTSCGEFRQTFRRRLDRVVRRVQIEELLRLRPITRQEAVDRSLLGMLLEPCVKESIGPIGKPSQDTERRVPRGRARKPVSSRLCTGRC